MKKFKIYLFLLLAIILQTTVINRFKLFGVFPNLIITLAFVYALFLNSFDAVVFGFVCGLSMDLLSGQIIGLNAILITYIALFVSFLSNKFMYATTLTVFVMSFFMTALYEFLFVFLNYIIWNNGTFLGAISLILLESLYNSVIASVGYYFIFKKYDKTVK